MGPKNLDSWMRLRVMIQLLDVLISRKYFQKWKLNALHYFAAEASLIHGAN